MLAANYLLTNIVAFGGLTYILCDICLTGKNWVLFLIRIIICCSEVVELVIILFYRKTDEYQYFMMLVKKVLKLSR